LKTQPRKDASSGSRGSSRGQENAEPAYRDHPRSPRHHSKDASKKLASNAASSDNSEQLHDRLNSRILQSPASEFFPAEDIEQGDARLSRGPANCPRRGALVVNIVRVQNIRSSSTNCKFQHLLQPPPSIRCKVT